MKVPAFAWIMVAFFFFAGLAFTIYEGTRWIGIGQIWMAVALVLAAVYLGLFGKVLGKLGGKLGGTGTAKLKTAEGGDTAEALQRLERLHSSGDLTDAEYQSQRQRIISQS